MTINNAIRFNELRQSSLQLIIPDDSYYKINSLSWAGVLIGKNGIVTAKGSFSPAELELLQWKANFYHRGRERMQSLRKAYPDPPEQLIIKSK